MAMSEEAAQERGRERMQDFIFARELAEVYLLLDHLSGRSDKSLAAAIGDGEDKTGSDWIEKICKIGWPPNGTSVEQAAQAATLLLAKDRLNAAAKPANGASIAFTLLVAGDDDATATPSKHAGGLFSWVIGRVRMTAAPPAPIMASGAPSNTLPSGGGSNGAGGSASPSGGNWFGEPPSRLSLAMRAYPGLVGRARQFNWQVKSIIFLLLFWLIFTCGLSWNIAAGRAILARLDAIETSKAGILRRIAAAELAPELLAARSTPDASALSSAEAPPPAQGARATADAATLTKSLPVVRYCDRPRLLPPAPNAPKDVVIQQFDNPTQRQLCDELNDNLAANSNGREDLADWLAPWGLLKWPSHVICGRGPCYKDANSKNSDDAFDEHQWAAVMVEVLSTAVLPLCYGFLGAGAAVVRNIWGKMRDSLLLPRDLTLSLGQLALGAVIGACIGLFIAPSGGGSQGTASLTGTITLTPSALSFIAGFGVEGVFIALESLIKRVFNIPDPKP
jgi:hypothetical protein